MEIRNKATEKKSQKFLLLQKILYLPLNSNILIHVCINLPWFSDSISCSKGSWVFHHFKGLCHVVIRTE